MCVCCVSTLAGVQNRSWTLSVYFHRGQSSGFSHFLPPLFLCSVGSTGKGCEGVYKCVFVFMCVLSLGKTGCCCTQSSPDSNLLRNAKHFYCGVCDFLSSVACRLLHPLTFSGLVKYFYITCIYLVAGLVGWLVG